MWDIGQCFLCKQRRLHICLLLSSAAAQRDWLRSLLRRWVHCHPCPPSPSSKDCAQCDWETEGEQHEGCVCASQQIPAWIKAPGLTMWALPCSAVTWSWRELSSPVPVPSSACPHQPLKKELSYISGLTQPPPSQSGNVSFGGMERVQTKASVTSRADFAHHTIIYKGGNHETINSSSQRPAYPLVRKILLRVPKHREELIAPSRLAPAGAPLSSLRLPHHSNNPEIRGAVIIDTAL